MKRRCIGRIPVVVEKPAVIMNQHYHILLAENEFSILGVLKWRFKTIGFEVDAQYSSKETLGEGFEPLTSS
jgi:hypothetical protein